MRLDSLLAARGLLPSREAAKTAILEGSVTVDGRIVKKPSADIDESARLELSADVQKYVGRGGFKLEKALEFFGIVVEGRVCLDLGASTGGFTDCLLQRGARLVYAVDVGHSQLAESLRSDSRVVSLEGINARELSPDMLEIAPELATVDLSFISLALVLPQLRCVLGGDGEAVCLVKPQFEAGRGSVGKNGIVRDEKVHIRVLEEFIAAAEASGFAVRGLTYSPVRGGSGNLEFLAHLAGSCGSIIDIRHIVKTAHTDVR